MEVVSRYEERRLLIEALLRSEEGAWRQFIRDFGPLIYSVLGRFPQLRDERDDAFQDVCMIVHRSVGTLRDPDKLALWLYSITLRKASDRVARRRRQPGVAIADVGEQLVNPETPVDEELAGLQEVAILHDLVGRLRPRCQRLLRALYLEDPPLAYAEIEQREGIPIGSIGPTRARCLDELRHMWGELPERFEFEVSEPGSERTT